MVLHSSSSQASAGKLRIDENPTIGLLSVFLLEYFAAAGDTAKAGMMHMEDEEQLHVLIEQMS